MCKNKEHSITSCVTLSLSLAIQLVEYPHGNGIEVLMGGGRRNFMPNTQADPEYLDKQGYRTDGRNLINEYLDKYPEAHYTWNKTTFDAIDATKTEKILGK